MLNTLLVTGAAGFVGSHALRFAAASSKYDYIVANDLMNCSCTMPKGKTFISLPGDFTDVKFLYQLKEHLEKLPNHKLTVWHIGGCFNYSASRELLYRINVLGTKGILELLNQLPKTELQRFIFWSGGVVYGNFNHPKGRLPAAENYPVNPQNDYGWSKKEAEDWVLYFHKNFGLPITIMRMAAIYGPNSRYGMANAFWLNATGQLAPVLVGNSKNRAALIHVEDVIQAADFLSWAPEANGEIYNIVDHSLYSLGKIIKFIGETLNNRPFTSFTLPDWVLRRLIELINRRSRQLEGKPIIDPELGNLVLLNSWMSNQKLRELARKYGREMDLLKYGDTFEGLRKTLVWYGGAR